MSVVSSFAENYITSHGGQFAACPPINHLQSNILHGQSELDVVALHYSAIVSIADAISGMRSHFYSWATVKLYYSVFYSVKALLLMRGRGLFHYDGKPGMVEIWPGGALRKLTASESRGGSHGQSLHLFSKFVPSHILLTPVGTEAGLSWLKGLRERVNYTELKMSDPLIPSWFAKSSGTFTLRQSLNAYVEDNLMYAFDEDHAALALPVLAARECAKEALARGLALDGGERAFLASQLKDADGPIAPLAKYLHLSV